MPILVQCAHCQQTYRVASSAVGKQAKCTKCGQHFAVAEFEPATVVGTENKPTAVSKTAAALQKPANLNSAKPQPAKTAVASSAAARPSAAKTRAPLTSKELAAAFREPFPRLRPKLSYRVGILMVSLTMVVLPLIYVGFIALVGFGVYYHAVNHTGMLAMGYGRSRVFVALAYAAPLIAGPIAIFFLFKPLLARPIQLDRSRSLTRQHEPLLFTFIDRVCEEVRAPRPKRIDVDCSVNASASFRRGIFSMLGNDLVLTIGLPLVAGLSLREFGGVMAHELGHFAQGMGMRLTYLVRSIVHWFIRVVYQRDEWDAWLEETAHELDIRVGWIFLIAQLFVAIGRGILWMLLHVGIAISGIMLRQMEYDADSCETHFAGSDAFASTVRKLHLLNGAFELAQTQISASLDYRKLVDNLPGLVAYHARQIAPEALPKIDKLIQESKTSWFDSHPCDNDRIAAAKKLARSGIFQSDRRAADLFANFPAQAAAATWNLYVGYFGPKVPRTALQPLPEFIAEHRAAIGR